MARQAPQIRDATPDDAEALLDLWSLTSRQAETSPRAVGDAERALANGAANPDERLLVALVDDVIVAAMQLSRGPLSPLVVDTAVHSSFLLVHPDYRRHGLGRALMEAAVSWAEEKDVHQITAITGTNRDTNRFFVRLGMATFANVRYASTPVLRKKLSGERARSGNRHLVEVLAQRRTMRRRQADA